MVRTVELAEIRLERSRARDVTQARQRLFLDLTHALARDAEKRADLLQRHGLLIVETEVQAQNLRLALLEVRQRLLDRLRERLLERLLVRRRIHQIRQIVEELVVLARRERRVEREVRLRDGHRLRDFLFRDLHPFGDLGVRRLAAQLLKQRARALADAVERSRAVQGHPYDATLL